jgi:hypothetical protein
VSAGAIARRALALALAGLVLGAGPAAADAAKPGRYSSEVTSVDPDPGTFSVETAGGDAFLEISVDDGTELLVLGYEGEPYLRFNPDGTVEENQNSPATFINAERFGTNELAPEELQGVDVTELEPAWEEVATGGTFAWHDHRTHFMGGQRPAGGELAWEVPLVVDGEDVVVSGVIVDEGSTSPILWYAVALIVLVGLAVLGPKLDDRMPAATVVVVALLATLVAAIGYSGQPSGTGASIVPTVVGGVAVVLGLLGLLVGRLRAVGLLTSGVFLATWGVFRLSVLSNPVLPTTVPFALERLTTALALGVGIGAVVVAFRSGALTAALLPLDDEDPLT